MNACSIPKDVCEQDEVSCPAGIHDDSCQREQGCAVAASGMAPSGPHLLVFIAPCNPLPWVQADLGTCSS